jgi:hypothetical protein
MLMSPSAHTHLGLSVAMLAWHGCAAALLGGLLAYGESVLWAGARRLAWAAVAAWRRLATGASTVVGRVRLLSRRDVLPAPLASRRRQLLWTASQIRRGPPPAPSALV